MIGWKAVPSSRASLWLAPLPYTAMCIGMLLLRSLPTRVVPPKASQQDQGDAECRKQEVPGVELYETGQLRAAQERVARCLGPPCQGMIVLQVNLRTESSSRRRARHSSCGRMCLEAALNETERELVMKKDVDEMSAEELRLVVTKLRSM
eukprot:767973-Hanusia_phi.AAC.3